MPYVVQVSLFGLGITFNQTESAENDRPGHGRIFVGLDEAQAVALLEHIRNRRVSTAATDWGAPTMVIFDLDQNEIFFWLSDEERARRQEAHEGRR